METIKLKCPDCSNILMVKSVPGIENKVIKCPVCKRSNLGSRFKRVVPKAAESTMYGEETDVGGFSGGLNIIPGVLTRTDRHPATVYKLSKGINVIGRMSSSSSAGIQIDTSPSRKMSRNHLQIEVKMVPGKGMVHYLSLCKQDVNATAINGSRILFGDSVVLNDGDVLSLPDAILKFSIPDEEMTQH